MLFLSSTVALFFSIFKSNMQHLTKFRSQVEVGQRLKVSARVKLILDSKRFNMDDKV